MSEVERGASRRVVVAEDTAPLRQVLLRALAVLGFEAEGVASAGELLTVVADRRPDAVLLDWNLEDGRAERVLRSLQDDGVPVLVVTGDPEGVPDCGAPVIGKPVRLEELRAHVEGLWRSS